MNDYSLRESASRARLAAKGAGYSWGMADEVYRSTFWLIQRNLPALTMLSQLLKQFLSANELPTSMPKISGSDYITTGQFLCPIMLGCALTDRVDSLNLSAPINFSHVQSPLLLLPFVAEVASKHDVVIAVELDGLKMTTDGKHLQCSSIEVLQLEHAKKGVISFLTQSQSIFDATEQLELHNRTKIDAKVWQALSDFAHRTYAPATEASRILGAGAGLQDND